MSVSSFPVEDHWVGIPPSIIMGARRQNLRLARGSAESVCLRAHCYLHHTPPRPHSRPRTLTTPLYATALHSHLIPAHTPALHGHLSFGYKLPVTARTPGLAPIVAKDQATLHIHSTHSINTRKHPTPTRLGKVYRGALVVPLSSPHQRAFVCGACIGTAQVSISLVSLFNPLFKGSRLHCFDIWRSPRSCPASNPANRQKAPGLPGGCGAKPHDFLFLLIFNYFFGKNDPILSKIHLRSQQKGKEIMFISD